jgi:hypothetical protein
MGSWKAYRKNPDSKTELYLIEEDTYTERDLAWLYPDIAKKATYLMDNSYTKSQWYWNPNETAAEYQEKVKLAKETNNILPVYRPNDIQKFPWEK